MTLAKCANCGEELSAPDDGKPYWCIVCSQKQDEKEQRRRCSRGDR